VQEESGKGGLHGGRETAEAIKLEPRLDRVDRKLDEILEKQITNQITI
jgi:hypothetical protein